MSLYPIPPSGGGSAVIDTSFWSLCCHSGLAPRLWGVWSVPLWVPSVVKQQIFFTPGPYADQRLFRHAEHAGRVAVRDPQQLIAAFRTGEREVLSLA